MILQGIRDLVLIRHGESLRNKESKGAFYKDEAERASVGFLQDWLVPMTKDGHRQARNAGKGLKRKFGTPDAVFHSGFVRTKETATGILNAYSLAEWRQIDIEENNLVRERNPGYLMNYTEKEVREIFFWWQEYWNTADRFSVIPHGGESIASMTDGRLLTFLKSLEDACHKKGGNTVFVVSHGRAIQGLRYLLEDWSYERVNQVLADHGEVPPNCSATHYEFDAYGKPHLQFANRNLF